MEGSTSLFRHSRHIALVPFTETAVAIAGSHGILG
jgi:hypothetical protein